MIFFLTHLRFLGGGGGLFYPIETLLIEIFERTDHLINKISKCWPL